MTLTQDPLSATMLRCNVSGRAAATVVTMLKSANEVSTPETFYDSAMLKNTDSITWNEYEIQFPLGKIYGIENLSPALQSLSNRVVAPVGDGGAGRVKVVDGGVSKILKCDTRKIGGQTYYEFVEYVEGSVSRYLYDQVAPLFDATPDLNYYSTYNHSTGSYTRNAACWAASIDLSCVAVASSNGSDWIRQRGGTLITPRHILIARHYAYGIGTQVRFSNAAGVVETRTVIGTSSAGPAGDLWVCTLNADVTVATPCKVAGTWVIQDRVKTEDTARWYAGGIVIHTDQNAKVYAASLGQTRVKVSSYSGSLTVGGTTFADYDNLGIVDHAEASAVPNAYSALRHWPVTGDSGQPSFVVVDGDPVLLMTWTYPNGGTPAYLHNGAVLNALIAISDTNAGVSTGYTVTVATNPTL